MQITCHSFSPSPSSSPPTLVPCSTVARLRVINKRLWMPQLVLLPLLLRLMNFLMIISASSGGDGDGAAVGHLSLRSALRFEGFLMDSSVESKEEEKNSENCVGEKVERGKRKRSSSFVFFGVATLISLQRALRGDALFVHLHGFP